MPTLAATLFACGTTDPAATRNRMGAVIDGVTWKATETEAAREGSTLQVEGSSAIGTTLRLTLKNDTVGTYPLGEGLHEGILVDEFTSWTAHGVQSGSVTITEIDGEHVTGYFGFRGKDTVGLQAEREVASGTFDIDFSP
ncbi:MAG: hypothetical protein KDD67_01940 [Ignavibacteriae bacterium]|nr:hypothetical protein [Ignavibacteriota bacterium]